MSGRLAGNDHHAAARRFTAAQRSAHLERLARDDRCRGMSDVHAVGVHHPRHHLLVRVDVRRGDVFFRSDGVDDFGDIAAGQRLQLAARHLRGIADDAALSAAERNVGDGAFPRHPGGQRRHLVKRDAGVVPDAALGGAKRDVVLHAKAGEHFDLAVVHLYRARHDDLPLGAGEDFPDARLEAEDPGCSIEFLQHLVEDGRRRHSAPGGNGPK